MISDPAAPTTALARRRRHRRGGMPTRGAGPGGDGGTATGGRRISTATSDRARSRRLRREFVPKGPGIKGGGIAAIGIGIGFAGSIAVAIGFYAAGSGHLDARNPWYMLVSQLALWAGFLGAVVVASRRNGTRSLARDYGLSWPRWHDLTDRRRPVASSDACRRRSSSS